MRSANGFAGLRNEIRKPAKNHLSQLAFGGALSCHS